MSGTGLTVVVGAGINGAWAALQALRSGADRVVLAEQYARGHKFGSSGGCRFVENVSATARPSSTGDGSGEVH
jgi:succinate dehydrogenase/fumarate reductase flavoprotein subunit